MKLTVRAIFFVYVFAASAAAGQETKKLDVVFESGGGETPSRQHLLDETNRCLEKYTHPKDRYDTHVLDFCLKTFLFSQGYLRPEIGRPKTQAAEGGLIGVVVPVKQGTRYRLGEIKIEGAKLFTPEQVVGMLDLKTGDVAGYGSLNEWLDGKVKRSYADRGHIQYNYDVEPLFKPASAGDGEGIVDFKIDIHEGPRFTVRRVEFTGNARTPDPVLRRALLVREGDVFSQSLYEDGIRNLNRLGLFEEIDKDKDVEFAGAGRDVPQLDLIIRVKERTRP